MPGCCRVLPGCCRVLPSRCRVRVVAPGRCRVRLPGCRGPGLNVLWALRSNKYLRGSREVFLRHVLRGQRHTSASPQPLIRVCHAVQSLSPRVNSLTSGKRQYSLTGFRFSAFTQHQHTRPYFRGIGIAVRAHTRTRHTQRLKVTRSKRASSQALPHLVIRRGQLVHAIFAHRHRLAAF